MFFDIKDLSDPEKRSIFDMVFDRKVFYFQEFNKMTTHGNTLLKVIINTNNMLAFSFFKMYLLSNLKKSAEVLELIYERLTPKEIGDLNHIL